MLLIVNGVEAAYLFESKLSSLVRQGTAFSTQTFSEPKIQLTRGWILGFMDFIKRGKKREKNKAVAKHIKGKIQPSYPKQISQYSILEQENNADSGQFQRKFTLLYNKF